MGCAVPLAIGRKLEEPERTVVATVGDAALEMFLGELATVRDLTLAIPIVIFVNTQLGLTELKQRSSQLPDLAVNFGATDFAAVAKALGGKGVRVRDRETSPGRSGPRSGGRLSRSSPQRSVRDPMTGQSDTHRTNRDPRRRRPVQTTANLLNLMVPRDVRCPSAIRPSSCRNRLDSNSCPRPGSFGIGPPFLQA